MMSKRRTKTETRKPCNTALCGTTPQTHARLQIGRRQTTAVIALADNARPPACLNRLADNTLPKAFVQGRLCVYQSTTTVYFNGSFVSFAFVRWVCQRFIGGSAKSELPTCTDSLFRPHSGFGQACGQAQ